MNLVRRIMTRNPCYASGVPLKPKGIMLHSTGTPQPKAIAYIASWDNPSFNSACVHGFIDAIDGTAYQTLPWNIKGWHCGKGSKGSCNATHIGIEMCEPAEIKYVGGASFTFKSSNKNRINDQIYRTYQTAVELFAELCVLYKLDPLQDGVILSHSEGHARGLASNHADVEHLWESSLLKTGLTMDGFRRDIWSHMDGDKIGESQSFSNAACPFRAKVGINNLFIRTGPGTNFPHIGKYTGVGVFTIVAVEAGAGSKCGWGLLKSYEKNRSGWIALDYATKV